MPVNVLFAAHIDRWETYRAPLQDAFSALGLDVNLALEIPADEVDYIIYAPSSPLQDFTPYTRAKAVLNLWAGVEGVTKNATLTIPLTRMVDPGMTKSMTEWVTGHVMRYHLGMDRHIINPDQAWAPHTAPLASERSVCILGMGELGGAVASVLGMLEFKISGWSRRAKSVAGVTMHHGDNGLRDVLSSAEIVILLLPDTAQTNNILNAQSLSWLPTGAFIINPGRGSLIDDQALLEALDSGQIAQATLDVFRTEPLPPDHPFWTDPRVTVTPHVAAETRQHTASQVIAENVRRGEAGEAFLNLVDRDSGY